MTCILGDDDKLQLLYNVNSLVKMAVKTPVGKSHREDIRNVVTQGDVFGPLLCSKQVDTFGKECLEEHKYTYLYKGQVEIPPLGMVDDLLCISECGFQTSMMNSFINFKTANKKLQFGVTKCKKLHIGKVCDDFKCHTLSVDNWVEEVVEDEEQSGMKIKDCFNGEEEIEETDSEKYLGDIISKDGKNMRNVKARVNKGTGIVNNIMTKLEGIPFGKYYFQVAIMLRNSLLVSSVLCNSEAWYNVTGAEYTYLETVDLMFLRKVLNAPKATPKEMLYLELGCLPFRYLIQKRRLVFLHYLLNEDSESMVHRCLMTQCKNANPKDWTSTVMKDIQELDIKMTFDEIKLMKKSSLANILNKAIEDKALKDLNQIKIKHSKVLHLKHDYMKMKKYLMPNKMKTTRDEIQLIFKLRSRMTNIKKNYEGMYDDLECSACGEEEESQQHILECSVLVNMNKDYEELPKYGKIFDGTVSEQVKIAKKFKQNMRLKENLKKD